MKLSEIQQQLKVPKTNFNKFGGYNFRSAEDIIEAVKKIINPAGIALVITDDIVEVGGRVYIKSTATIGEHSATGWAREDESLKGMSSAQVTGSASSYARKYALNGLLAIDDTKDADATNTHDKEETPEQKAIMDIRNLVSLESLQAFWTMLPKELKANKQVLTAKDARKEQLSKGK